MDKIYIVTSGCYSDTTIEAAFTEDQKDAADHFAAQLEDGYVDEVVVNPIKLNPPEYPYEVTLISGQVTEVEKMHRGVANCIDENFIKNDPRFTVFCFAKDEDEAKQKALAKHEFVMTKLNR